jgi:hypothetical protein
MPTTVCDLWFVTKEGCAVNMRAPLFTSRQIEREVHRANMERRDGRTDWMAIDLEEVIMVYGENRAATAIDHLMHDLRQTRH